jgi:hypothetical protein
LSQWQCVKWKSPQRFPSLVLFQASFPLPELTCYESRSGAIGFSFGQHGPCNAGQLVGYCHDQNVPVRSGFQLAHPLTHCVVVSIQTHDDGARAMNEQSPEIRVAAFTESILKKSFQAYWS